MKTTYDSLSSEQNHGSFMPVDAESHWDWKNPLDLLILLPVVLLLLAIVL